MAQRGVATLVVVMVLFFILTMVAAYANRNLIFEQRTSANQLRATQALEAAEAGMEWAISMLNHGRIDATCSNSTATPASSENTFRQRYLQVAASGRVTPVPDPSNQHSAACVYNGSGWDCSCPASGAPSVVAPTGNETRPAFRVRFLPVTGHGSTPPAIPPTSIRVQVVGCTRADIANCLNFDGQGTVGEGRAITTAILGLAGRMTAVPQAPLTAKGNITLSGGAAYNTHTVGNGITLHAGGAVSSGSMQLVSGPGTTTAAGSVVASDPALALPDAVSGGTVLYSSADRMFSAAFNTSPAAFLRQQGLITLSCAGSGCTAQEVRTAHERNPGRPIRIDGDLVIDSNGDIGSVAEPVLLVVDGEIVHTLSGVTVVGFVYQRPRNTASVANTWSTSGTGTFRGAVVAQGNVGGTGLHTFQHDADVLTTVRWNVGSYVRLPSSWRDYQ